jgi:AbiV family abortive infection protein
MAGRYPSSFVMAILSMEEAGKLQMLDWMCDVIGQDPDRMADTIKSIFSKRMALSHKKKQEYAVREKLLGFKRNDPYLKEVASGSLERKKQNAIYVGLSQDSIILPRKTSKDSARAQIKKTFRLLRDIDDLGFNGFNCNSSPTSEKRARQHIRQMESLLRRIEIKSKR